jgi:hypothetical protein
MFNQYKMIAHQTGQGMVEYVVVLTFGVMVLTIGPGGDVLLDLLAVMNDNHQGYSYAASLSTLPDADNIGQALGIQGKADQLASKVSAVTNFSFESFTEDMMPSMQDIMAEGVSSILDPF